MAAFTLRSSPFVCGVAEKVIAFAHKKHPGCEFIDEIAVETKPGSGNYTYDPVLVFYQENPPDPTFSKYFIYYQREDYPGAGNWQWYITSGATFQPVVRALLIPNDKFKGGEIIYSRYRHDYFTSKDGHQSVDGGMDYFRSTLGGVMIEINLHTQEFKYYGKTYKAKRPEAREALRFGSNRAEAAR